MMLLYIDPGTGSMLISLFIGLATTAIFGARILYSKFKYIFTGEKAKNLKITDNERIVIFSDHKRYWNVFKPICDEFEKRQIPISFYTASSDDPTNSKSISCPIFRVLKFNSLHCSSYHS